MYDFLGSPKLILPNSPEWFKNTTTTAFFVMAGQHTSPPNVPLPEIKSYLGTS